MADKKEWGVVPIYSSTPILHLNGGITYTRETKYRGRIYIVTLDPQPPAGSQIWAVQILDPNNVVVPPGTVRWYEILVVYLRRHAIEEKEFDQEVDEELSGK